MTTPTTETEPKDRWAGVTAGFYARQVAAIADRLRHLAEDVERAGEAKTNRVGGYSDGLPEYVNSAERVVHAVTWGMANLSLDGLISAASEADRAARHIETSS